ncbi:ABC transporter ATP-binding protein [Robbsia sp. KACC 23696]|uniref:ABC transporter ATP-binding protein n=1 Tax=Robbsia sp. KACC 23696 TaxID=3149231 RepID=UPI00325AD1DE
MTPSQTLGRSESDATDASPAVHDAIALAHLRVRFHARGKVVKAVNDVSLHVAKGEALALIGESGSGKSVTLRAMMRLHPPRVTEIEGSIRVFGEDVMAASARQLAALRGGKVAMVFQEPLLALDPVYTVGQQIAETVRAHSACSRGAARQRALALLQAVRIPSPERRLDAYPHEMSGGMRQRAMIALALAGNPQILLADEPTTALDATVQIQVLILLRELQRELGLSIVFVTHDLGAAVEIADRIAVMYGGSIVEEGDVRSVTRAPRHPYTVALLRSRQEGGMRKGERLEAIAGAPPDLSQDIPGCAFAPRCAHAMPVCTQRAPTEVPSPDGANHRVRCFLYDAKGHRIAPIAAPGEPPISSLADAASLPE